MRALEAIARLEQVLAQVDEPARDAYYIITELLALSGQETPLVAEVSSEIFNEAVKIARRRSKGEPLQYIFGRAYFMDLVLKVEPGVFIPRPETESLVSVASSLFPRDASIRIWDVGTGSACIAISLARAYPNARLVASDISQKALDVARKNIESYNLSNRIELIKAAGISGVSGEFDMVVSNPPYVRTQEMHQLDREVLLEPTEALWGGDDGAALSRELIERSPLKPGSWLVLETSPFIAEAVLKAAQEAGFKAEIIPDLFSMPRVIKAFKPKP